MALVLPPGGGAALVILLLAGLLGSPALAGLGAVVEAGFLWRFYADLRLDLMQKSGLLVAVGLVLLAAWAWLERRAREDRP
ncbi:MAG: DUF4401 domain-containing protein [Hyphomicrobiales bacterium]|nr:DUF4401 domain-containing protein [Hyphomicrobiales bacterium]